jgi:hypothetical protein
MNTSLLDRMIRNVLYGGFILYPYKTRSHDGRRKFSFGNVVPQKSAAAKRGNERFMVQTECLVERTGHSKLEAMIRFLQPLRAKKFGMQKSIEHKVTFETELPASGQFHFCRNRLHGLIEFSTEAIDERVARIRIRLRNLTHLTEEEGSFASTHTVLKINGGKFLSLVDLPAQYRKAAADCHNIGTYPVLFGDKERGERNQILSSPLFYYDYPQLFPLRSAHEEQHIPGPLAMGVI